MANTNYYDVLGVDKSATDDEIKRAFRKKAQQYHPDAGGSEEKFKEINEAYDVLSDKTKRKNYDRFGSPEGFAGFGGANAGYAGGSPFAGGNINFDLSDLFNNIRNGEGAFGSNWDFRSNRQSKGQDLSANI
ncbi:MAG: DnaJ domain-containing protein, partial [Clostridia bacterium]|nr:DnaJ domain-containing protein [Clostridia bacterium]